MVIGLTGCVLASDRASTPAAEPEAGLAVPAPILELRALEHEAAPPPSSLRPLTDGERRALWQGVASPSRSPSSPAAKLPVPSVAPPAAASLPPWAPGLRRGAPGPSASPVVALRPALPAPQVSLRGQVAHDAELRVSFAEPMVAVGEAASPQRLGLALRPAVEGAWRWLAPQVAGFTPRAGRWPGASELELQIPAGVRSIGGATSPALVRYRFTTPPLRLTRVEPSILGARSPLALVFDQPFEPDEVLAKLRIFAGAQPVELRELSIEEAKLLWGPLAARLPPLGPYTLLVAPLMDWPGGGVLTLELPAGVRARGGTLPTIEPQVEQVLIAPVFAVQRVTCGHDPNDSAAGARCAPGDRLKVEFSNPPDPASGGPVSLAGKAVQPRIDVAFSLEVPVGSGPHPLSLPVGLRDVHGQSLEAQPAPVVHIDPSLAAPFLDGADGLVVLDPRFAVPQWTVRTQRAAAVRVRLLAVQPRDYFAYHAARRDARRRWPGRLVSDRTLAVDEVRGSIARIDLRAALGAAGTGHVLALATAEGQPGGLAAWIQVTRLAALTQRDRSQLRMSVQAYDADGGMRSATAHTSLLHWQRGKVVASPEVETDERGFASHRLPSHGTIESPIGAQDDDGAPVLAVARTESDAAFVELRDAQTGEPPPPAAHWYVTDAPGRYRPGELLRVKGFLRWRVGEQGTLLVAAHERVRYELVDGAHDPLASGEVSTSEQGGFELSLPLPTKLAVGYGMLRLSARGHRQDYIFEIQEEAPPLSSEVTMRAGVRELPGWDGALAPGEAAAFEADTRDLAGGALAGALLRWHAAVMPTRWQPPGWDGFDFGDAAPTVCQGHEQVSTTVPGSGRQALQVQLHRPAADSHCALEVATEVVDRDSKPLHSAPRRLLLHPASYVVGVRAGVAAGQLEVVVTDLAGVPVVGAPVTVELLPSAFGLAASALARRCRLVSAHTPVSCRFEAAGWGWQARARVLDGRGRAHATRSELMWAPATPSLEVVSERASWAPGSTAKVFVRSAVVPASAIVTVSHGALLSQQRVELRAPQTTVEVAVPRGGARELTVTVQRLAARGPAARAPWPLPELSEAEVRFAIDPSSRRLEVALDYPSSAEPGALTTFTARVSSGGTPVSGAEVALMVVDDTVRAASEYEHADPLRSFEWSATTERTESSTFEWLTDAGDELFEVPGVTSADEVEQSGGGYWRGRVVAPSPGLNVLEIPRVYRDFRSDVLWAPRLRTDAKGEVSARLVLPAASTRYRVVALAAAGAGRFGRGKGELVVRRSLELRLDAPRWLSVGDSAALTAVVINQGPRARSVEVAVRGAGVDVSAEGQRLELAAGQRAELRFVVRASKVGDAAVQAIARAGGDLELEELALPVRPPAALERGSFSTWVGGGALRVPLVAPADIDPAIGGLEITLATSELGGLAEAFWDLQEPPYDSAEQRSARMLATASLSEVLSLIEAPGRPSRAQLLERLAADAAELARAQAPDGGWGLLPGMAADPYVTMQVVRALTSAQPRGASAQALRAGVEQVRALVIAQTAALAPSSMSSSQVMAAAELLAAALATLQELGVTAGGEGAAGKAALEHAAQLGALSVSALARLVALSPASPSDAAARQRGLAALEALLRETDDTATVEVPPERASVARFVGRAGEVALVLDALTAAAPGHRLIDKLARGLFSRRRAGRLSPQDGLLVVQALWRARARRQGPAPNLVARVFLGGRGALERSLSGQRAASEVLAVPWSELAGVDALLVSRDGVGPLALHVAASFAPRSPRLSALDAGFAVRRSYAATNAGDLVRLPDGSLRVRLGALLRVTVEVETRTARAEVAVVDELAAGFEALAPRASAEAQARFSLGADTWEHQRRLPTRTEAFASKLAPGGARLEYLVRAVTPGTFWAAPAHAEELYRSEGYGRSSSERFVIE